MDSVNISHLKAKKAKAIKKHRQLRKVGHLLRLIELCTVFVLISRFFIDVQVAVDYFKDFRVYFSSPKFVFVIGNVIVITLFAMSGQFSSHDSRTDFYQEFIENSQRIHARPSGSHRAADISRAAEAADGNLESKKRENHCDGHISCPPEVVEETLESEKYENRCAGDISCAAEAEGDTLDSKKYEKHCAGVLSCAAEAASGDTLESKKYQRSRSELIKISPNREKANKQLRRSATDKSEKERDPGDRLVRSSSREDKMSNEEFRSTIEAFIASQKRRRMDEEISVI